MAIPEESLEARLARVRRHEHVRGLRKREWVVLGIFLALVVFALFNFKRVVVRGDSMMPSLHSGESVMVWKSAPRSQLKPGDVIVFKSADGDELIKRIAFVQNAFHPIPLPATVLMPSGRRLPLGQLFSPENSPYFSDVDSGDRVPAPRANTIYVLGDNLPVSDDSRDFGPINPQQILGKVVP